MSLNEVHRLSGPNFHRLQIYSNIWEELMTVTPTFGDLLAGVKVRGHYSKFHLQTKSRKQMNLLFSNLFSPPHKLTTFQTLAFEIYSGLNS